MMMFCTAINCMDGRTQIPVIEYLKKRFNSDHVDSITEPGPNLILAENINRELIESIFNRVEISVDKHKSNGIAVVGHFDCAGNPADKKIQTGHIIKAVETIKQRFADIEVIGLWIGDNWKVTEI